MTIWRFPFLRIAIVAKGGQFVVCTFQVATRDIVQKQGDRLALGCAEHRVGPRRRPACWRANRGLQLEGIFIKRV